MTTRIGISISTIMALAIGAATFTYAQGQTSPPSTTKPTTTVKVEDVTKWTQEQWNAAKAKWSKETAKWGDCQKQADAKKLSGRESWSFLYGCMTK
jgi:hypothetical protein